MDISIIIPTYKRPELLRQCLESVLCQDYPVDKLEVIVVMDGESVATEEMLREISKKRENLKYVKQKNKGPAAARNLGASMARSDVLAFTDDDCLLDKDWARNMVGLHKANPAVAAVGGLTTALNNAAALVSQSLANGAIRWQIDKKEEIIFLPTCNVSFKRCVWSEEKFNEQFSLPAGEDLEYFWRLFKKGQRFLFSDDIKVLHNRQVHPRYFFRQAYMYGRGNLLVKHIHSDHPVLKELKTESTPIFILGVLVNILKIPRFSCLLGRRLINSSGRKSFSLKSRIYLYFILHKTLYIAGNIFEYIRISRRGSHGLSGSAPKIINEAGKKPDFIILDITHRCNLKCNICEIRKDASIDEFNTAEVKSLIRQSVDWGVSEFVLSGGEPLVRDDIFHILDFVKQKNYHIGVLTNGILLNNGLVERLAPYLISNTLSLSISLDALTPQTHDRIRGCAGCFEKTFNGLKILSSLKKAHPRVNFNVISIILNENLEELLPLANILMSLNIDSLQFQPLLANNLVMKERQSKGGYWVPLERLPVLDNVIDELIEFKRGHPDIVRNSENNLRLVKKYFRRTLTNEDIKCRYADRVMLIANNGYTTTCFDCYGDTRKDGLQPIYFSKSAQLARQRASCCRNPCLLPCFTDYKS